MFSQAIHIHAFYLIRLYFLLKNVHKNQTAPKHWQLSNP